MTKINTHLTLRELEKIKLLKADGLTTHAIAKSIGRDAKTVLKALARPGMEEAVGEIRKTLVEKYEEINHRCLDSVLQQGEIEKMTPDKKIVAAAVCTDKTRLLNDLSTANLAIRSKTEYPEHRADERTVAALRAIRAKVEHSSETDKIGKIANDNDLLPD